jgi:K+-sensing histidine kinase KdpD
MQDVPLPPTVEAERERLHRSVLNSISHDLKTPLACIIGSLEICERATEKLSFEQRATLIQTALKEAYRLDSFITNILDMAKLESGTVKVKKEPIRLEHLLDDCLITLGPRLSACEVYIKATPSCMSITSDPVLLARAVCILLENSAKYGTERPIIHITYQRAGDQVVIRVEDNGPGIADHKMEEVFSKYARLSAQDSKQAGTGLGLPICREILRLLGGTVRVENLPHKKGAVFTLSFPA